MEGTNYIMCCQTTQRSSENIKIGINDKSSGFDLQVMICDS